MDRQCDCSSFNSRDPVALETRVTPLGVPATEPEKTQYHREQYPKVQETVRHLLEGEPVVRTFDVHTYVGQKIAAGKAAQTSYKSRKARSPRAFSFGRTPGISVSANLRIMVQI